MEYDVGEGLVLRPIEISWLAEHCTHHLASRADGQRAEKPRSFASSRAESPASHDSSFHRRQQLSDRHVVGRDAYGCAVRNTGASQFRTILNLVEAIEPRVW